MCDDDLRCVCASNDECATHLACRGGVCGRCVEDGECRCDQYCAAGECRPRCTSDADCEGGRCAPAGHCVICVADDDCPGEERCYEDGCVGPCTGGLFSCAPFVPRSNGRCGLCGECDRGPRTSTIRSCP